MPPKTEQHAYPFNAHLHSIEEHVNMFFDNPLTLEQQLRAAERLLIGANRIHALVSDQINSAAANPHARNPGKVA